MAKSEQRSAQRARSAEHVEVKPQQPATSQPPARHQPELDTASNPSGLPAPSARAREGVPHLSWAMSTLHAEIRIELLLALARGEARVGAIAESLQREFSQVSQHLVELTSQGFVVLRRAGKHHFYRLAPGVQVREAEGTITIGVTRGSWRLEHSATRGVPSAGTPVAAKDSACRAAVDHAPGDVVSDPR